MSNVLDLVDQTAFVGERATGTTNLLQCVWVYDRAIDIDGVRRFHHYLQQGRLSRRIERSPLPFGRHRWVSPGDQPELEIAAPRPRDEFDAWLSEQADTALDAEHGPGWHLAVLPFTDGGAGLSFVTSHCLIDGVGLCEALAAAAAGRSDSISWPAAGSRRRWQALREDARQAVRDMPAIGRAVVAAARFARRHRGGDGSDTQLPSAPRSPFVGPDERDAAPKATIFIDADEWDARARSLGGTSNALLAGVAARLAQRAGRVTADGFVTVALPVNERTLTPLLPQWLIRGMAGVALGGATTSGSSNLGALDPAANRPDGTDADYFAMRTFYPGVTKATLHRAGGLLGLLSGRVHGQVFVSVLGYQPGRPNTIDDLWRDLSSALSDSSLTASVRPPPLGLAR